ncbi:MAG: phosphoribulokinase [Acidobacteriota bacterium]|nr:phosphoribulokinase [Acidobacteriota bacterium]
MSTRTFSLALALVLALPLVASAQQPDLQNPVALDRWLSKLGRPFVIGIAGDSGSGKSTFARGLTATLGADRVKVICVDDYHRLDRNGRKAAGVTALNPVATDLDRLARDLGTLREGRAIQKPVYDHSNGTLAPPEAFAPGKIIIVEGLHPFATNALKDKLDLSVYFDPSARVKEGWKIKRDVSERGHKAADVRKEIRARKPDFKAYVEPQRGAADVLVSFDWSKQGKQVTEELSVKLREKNLTPTSKRIRVNQSQAGQFVLRAERRRDGSGVTTIDGALPPNLLAKEISFLAKASGVRNPEVDRKSATLDGARVLVSARVMREIARKAYAR